MPPEVAGGTPGESWTWGEVRGGACSAVVHDVLDESDFDDELLEESEEELEVLDDESLEEELDDDRLLDPDRDDLLSVL